MKTKLLSVLFIFLFPALVFAQGGSGVVPRNSGLSNPGWTITPGATTAHDSACFKDTGGINLEDCGAKAPLASPALTDTPAAPATLNGYPVSRVICQSGASTLIYATPSWTATPLGATLMSSCIIPAGAMGLNGALRITATWTGTSSSNAKYWEIAFGTWGGSLAPVYALSFTYGATFNTINTIANRNNASTQTISNYSTLGALATGTINTSLLQSVNLYGLTSLETGITQTVLSGNGSVCTATVAAGAYATGDYGIVSSGTGCGTGTQNSATPVLFTNISGTQYSYPCTCNGGTPISGSGQRYSRIQLEAYTVELIPGAN